MMRRLIALCALGLLSLSACDKQEAPAPAATEAASAPAAPPTAAAPAPAPEPVVDVATLPVEEQYEADAEKQITASNLSAQLDALEKEIAGP
jgi:hypothetical protein